MLALEGILGSRLLRRKAAALLTAACVLLLGACQSTKAGAVVNPGASGCGSGSISSTTLSLTVGGHRRTAIVHVPLGYLGVSKVALVLNLHGSGSTAAEQEAFTGMDGAADLHHFVVAYPQALIPDGTGFDWNIPGVPLIGGRAVPRGAANDIAFLTQLVSALEQRYCIDPRMVYATGFSGGARMTSQLGCDASAVFAAIAPVSGLRLPSPCPTARAVPVISFHGTADPVDPYAGHGQAYWTYSVPQAASDWAHQDRCDPHPDLKSSDGYSLTTYVDCAADSEVELYTVDGEGHEWPGGPRLRKSLTRELGPQSDAVDANSAMWAFFSNHPMP